MVVHTIDGNKDYRQGLELTLKLEEDDKVLFRFKGGCDDRSYPVLHVVDQLHKKGFDMRLLAEFPYGAFRYEPENNRPKMPHDIYSLIGSGSGDAVHPQYVNEIVAKKKNS
ncbi:hypothetical protein HOK51_08810 [Candidatus Woesearchaeota archaeon]|nr:hypothetical protein [Candidatus Woesearchaeota archaeon]MBT6519928.1 hypothetical protein [Candidatus Woesearchaeota archaeon]MBT7367096.1 hypothetical protein [Candidatus Woesearchaeota archaeon]